MSTTEEYERKLTLGNGIPITDPNWIAEHLVEYVPFDYAAQLISPTWTRHHLHKEIKMNRVFLGEVLIIHDLNISGAKAYSQGKKFYITLVETERIKEEYAKRPKRKLTHCEYGCGKQERYCATNPCTDRIRNGTKFKQTVEAAAEYFERIRTGEGRRKRHFSAFNRRGERKNLRNSKGTGHGRTYVPTGSSSDR